VLKQLRRELFYGKPKKKTFDIKTKQEKSQLENSGIKCKYVSAMQSAQTFPSGLPGVRILQQRIGY